MPGPERRLAAILSADIAGYTRLIAEDEDETIRLLTARRQQVGLLLEQHRGRLVDFTGDNFLAEFASAVDAVECAVEIQGVGRGLNAALPPERRLEFRIGVHLGEIREEDGRLFGNGVNVASRLEGIADPGGVCISAKVHEEVSGRTPFSFRNIGEQRVKNIPERVHAYAVDMPEASPAPGPAQRMGRVAAGVGAVAVLAAVSWWAWPQEPAEPLSDREPPTSLVVLPFDDLSPNGDQAYFAEGMSEELINVLTRVSGLEVKGRTTGAVVKAMRLDIPQIGEQTGVGAVVEGSVRKSGERLRVSVQLIAVEDGFHLWSQAFDRPLGDVFAIQDEVARRVAEALQVSLRERELPTTDLGAYDEYLLGMNVVNRLSNDGVRAAIAHYRRALDLDPVFAEAHAALAVAYGYQCNLGFDDCAATMSSATRSARRALSINDGLSIAHRAIGEIRARADYDWEGAERTLRRAAELSPGDAEPHRVLGQLLVTTGRVREGVEEMEHALRLDPYSPQVNLTASSTYHAVLRDLERSETLGAIAARLAPETSLIGVVRAAIYRTMGRQEDAIQALLAPPLPDTVKSALNAAFRDGGIDGAFARLIELQAASSGDECTRFRLFGARLSVLVLRDNERALRCLARGYEDRSLSLSTFLKTSWMWDPLRDDPRFQAILEGMNLADGD